MTREECRCAPGQAHPLESRLCHFVGGRQFRARDRRTGASGLSERVNGRVDHPQPIDFSKAVERLERGFWRDKISWRALVVTPRIMTVFLLRLHRSAKFLERFVEPDHDSLPDGAADGSGRGQLHFAHQLGIIGFLMCFIGVTERTLAQRGRRALRWRDLGNADGQHG
jgi:hypothetical protein